MTNFLPALCYHPTTVVFIDDNQNFLQNIRFELDYTKAVYRFFNDPIAALKALEQYNFSPFTDRCLNRADDAPNCPKLEAQLRKIHCESHNPKRFEEISTLVVDYAMPQLNGVELCEKLKSLPIKKIILTAEADEKLAVQAFNAGIIDQFIRKDQKDFSQLLNNIICEMQLKYFQNLSQIVADNLKRAKEEDESPFLSDPVFRDFFDKTYNSLNAVEYYLMNYSGGFMFLDINGKPTCLAVKTHSEMQDDANYSNFYDAPSEITNVIKECKEITYFHTDQELDDVAPPQWGPFLHPTQRLEGKLDIYYYAIITDLKKYQIGEVLSFAKYCEKNN